MTRRSKLSQPGEREFKFLVHRSLSPILYYLILIIMIVAVAAYASYEAFASTANMKIMAESSPSTDRPQLTLVPTFESISVYVAFTADDNANNQAQLFYRPSRTAKWIQGMEMTVDRRPTVTSDIYVYDNPYINQWRASLIGLNPNSIYDVKVVLSDPDTGTSALIQSISTRDDTFPSTGNSYYVSPSGSDSNPGSLAQPFKTIQNGVNRLQAGDTLYVRGGVYMEEVVIAQRVGTPANWITIQAYPNEAVTINGQNSRPFNIYIGGWADPKTQYVRIKGMYLTNATTAIGINERASNIVIDDNSMDSFVDSAVYVGRWNTPNTPTSQIVIQNNTITRNKLPGPTGSTNIGLYSNGGGNVIRYNVIKDITGNPNDQGASHLDCIGGGPDFSLDTGLYRDTDVYGNTIVDCNDDAIQADGSAMNVRIWDNVLQGINTNWSGISTAPTIVGPLYIFRNLIVGQLLDGLKQGQNTTGVQYIYHNTFYSAQPNADGFFQTNPGLKNVVAKNNIIQSERYVIEYSNDSNTSGNSFDSNNLKSSKPNYFIFLNGASLDYNAFRNLGFENNGVNINATDEFVNPAAGDFSLKPGSSLADRGVLIPGFNDQSSKWAYGGSAPDLGAYEVSAAINFFIVIPFLIR